MEHANVVYVKRNPVGGLKKRGAEVSNPFGMKRR